MPTGDYRAVTICHSATCCRSVAALDGKRFLSNNAPALPLANCSTPGLCQCEYRTLNERRDDFKPKQASPRTGLKGLAMRLFSGRRGTDSA